MYKLIKVWNAGEIEAAFFQEEGSGIVNMAVLPKGGTEKIVPHREIVSGTIATKMKKYIFPASLMESMVQIKFTGDYNFAQHCSGVDMRNSTSIDRFHFVSQTENGNTLCTVFESDDNMRLTHTLIHPEGCRYLECKVEFFNGSKESRRVEMFPSFSMGMISPYHENDAPCSLKLHRFPTFWSSETRHLEQTFEELNMECSWQSAGVRAERFGQRSSMVNKHYHPFAAVEDTKNGIVWAAAVEAIGPWQMTVSRFCDFVNISGGLPDREFDGWFKDVAPGETLTSPAALMTACHGTCTDAARNLLPYQKSEEPQQSLAPTFSEWCTTWGTPAEERLLKIAPIAADLGIKYLQVDAGWFHADKPGDWVIKDDLYPRGFRAFSESLQKLGMESGIWFEFETIYPGKKTLEETGKENMVLKIDGFPLKTGGAYFLDFRKPEVIKHLTEKVADFLRDNKVGYLKIDYNSCIPFGIDGESKSYAQNLQDHMVEVRKFHENLHKLVPGLRIEECASGGHRLTPGWAKFGEYVSCSDAHEGIEIPLIAAEVMRFCYYDKALVWATLRSDDDSNRLSYSLCAGFLGQMTLSGDLDLLSSEQIETVRRYLDFYAKLSPELRLGGKLRIDCSSPSRMYPTGRQIVTLETEKEFLQIIHFFETDVTAEEFALPAGDWELVDSVKADSMKLAVENGKTKVGSIPSFSAAALLFRKK